jgi:glycosyltransferase involved in cell wall biosynthesis
MRQPHMAPKVSICIPTYNRRCMFRATLWSVLRQTYTDFDVTISDNASEEDIEAEVAATRDPRVRYIRQPVNLGDAANFRALQTMARGEYVLFLCSDDLLLPDCLSKAVRALDEHPHLGGAVYMAAHYGEEGFKFLSSMPDRDHATGAEYIEDRAVRDFRFASPSLCLYRRTAFERLGGWRADLHAVIDWEMYSRMVRNGGGVMFLHDVLAIMRLHENRASNTTALHWGFYHDVMKLSAQPEHPWGGAYRAKAIVNQLVCDWRLRQSPRRTLAHAHETGAFPGVLLYFPWEIARRLGVKLKTAVGRSDPAHVAGSTGLASSVRAEREALDRFWHASEAVRTGEPYLRGA